MKPYVQAYLENRPLFYAFIRPQEALLFHRQLSLIKSPILDFGCGDGFFAHLVFGPRSIDVGLDLAQSRIRETKDWPAYKKTVVYDGRTLPFPDQHFQTVISNCVFEHLSDLNQNLAEIHRILKPGGHLITTVATDRYEDFLLGSRLLGEPYRRYFRRQQVHLNLFSKSKWQTAFTKAGFQTLICTGYFGSKLVKHAEVSHFLAIPSLVSYRLWQTWILYPNWYRPFHLDRYITGLFARDSAKTAAANAGGLFWVLEKN